MWFVVNATNRCNLNCRTCLRSRECTGDVDPELLRSTIPKLKPLGLSGISITGGEPMMHPDFNELVRIVVSAGLLIGVVSNGILYKKYIETLEDYRNRVSFVTISLDSYKKDINDYIRGKGSFDRATRAIAAFKKKGFFVNTSHVVNKKNLKDLGPFVEFVLKLGADAVNVLGTIKTPENESLVLNREEKDEFHARLRILKLIHGKKLAYASSTGYFNDLIFCSNLNRINDMTLDFMGNLTFCCDTIHGGAVLGNLKDEGFENLLDRHLTVQSLLRAERIQSVLHHRSRETNDCDFCNRVLKDMIMR